MEPVCCASRAVQDSRTITRAKSVMRRRMKPLPSDGKMSAANLRTAGILHPSCATQYHRQRPQDSPNRIQRESESLEQGAISHLAKNYRRSATIPVDEERGITDSPRDLGPVSKHE